VTIKLLPLLLSLSLTHCDRPAADPVILSLGDQVIRRSDFERHVGTLQPKGSDALTPEVRRALLQSFLEERALVLEARSRGLLEATSTPEEEQAALQRLLAAAVAGQREVSDEEIRAYYGEHGADLRVPEKVWLRQILLPTENEARDVKRRLAKDPTSFEALARTRSRSPEASTGGAMGAFARGELPPELEAVAFALAPGTASEVARTSLGWHVLRVERREPAHEPSLQESRERIRTDILRLKSDQAWRQFVRAVMARAKVNHEIADAPPPHS